MFSLLRTCRLVNASKPNLLRKPALGTKGIRWWWCTGNCSCRKLRELRYCKPELMYDLYNLHINTKLGRLESHLANKHHQSIHRWNTFKPIQQQHRCGKAATCTGACFEISKQAHRNLKALAVADARLCFLLDPSSLRCAFRRFLLLLERAIAIKRDPVPYIPFIRQE